MEFRMLSHVFFAAVLVLSLPFGAWPAPLPFGDNLITGTSVAAQPSLAGPVLEDIFTPYNFSGGGATFRGVVESRVVRSTLNGTLDFYWRIIPDVTSTRGIDALRMVWPNSPAGVVLDANWRSDDLGNVAPNTARNFDPTPNLNVAAVNFLFPGTGVGPTDSSRFFFDRTDATAYDRSGFYDLLCDAVGAVSPEFTTFAPIPEPSAVALAALGMLGLFTKILARLTRRDGEIAP